MPPNTAKPGKLLRKITEGYQSLYILSQRLRLLLLVSRFPDANAVLHGVIMSILKIPWIQRCGFKNDLHKLGDFLSQYVKNESKTMPPGIRRLSYTRVTYALPPNSVMNVFNRDHKLMQRERAARAEDVELYDYVKDEVGYRLSDRIFDIKRRFKKALDLGCGRGHVSKHILSDSVEELILADMCPTWLNQAQTTESVKVEKMIVDEENMPFDPDSLDLVISCLSLHWVNDLPGCFSQIIRSLRNDGVFMAAVFGGDTLYELRSSLQLAELEREGGISPHISPFTEIRDIGSLLNRAGFTMLTVDTDEIVVGFPTMYELMWDLKGMGENNAARNRKLHLKRDTTLAAASIYEEFYGKLNEKDGSKYIPATFQIIYMLGWKPDVSQPKPLNRGTGEVSLKNLHRLDQIIKETKKIKLSDEDK